MVLMGSMAAGLARVKAAVVERVASGSLLYEIRQNGLLSLPGEFMNDPEGNEWHAWWLGFFTPLERRKIDSEILAEMPPAVAAFVRCEWWYYKGGQFVCRLILLLIALAFANATVLGWF